MSNAATRGASRRGNRLERLREIVSGDGSRRHPPGGAPVRVPSPSGMAAPSRTDAAAVLGGTVEDGRGGPCTVVRRMYRADHRYGRQRLGGYPGPSNDALSLLAGRPVWRDGRGDADRMCRPGSVVCLDLETTGLSGGAGTVAFLVGLGWFDSGAFRTHQYFLSHLGDESRMLRAVAQELSAADTVVTFNGRSFDAPVTETRFTFHRLTSPLGSLRHVDLLHPGRRLWQAEECRLVRLEREVLGLHRVGDVPGAEIPARYVGFLRGGDARLLAPVFEHNRLDLISLGVLTGLACRLVRDGAVATGVRRKRSVLAGSTRAPDGPKARQLVIATCGGVGLDDGGGFTRDRRAGARSAGHLVSPSTTLSRCGRALDAAARALECDRPTAMRSQCVAGRPSRTSRAGSGCG